jgi:ABC-type hemin transport system substrate-binding protein
MNPLTQISDQIQPGFLPPQKKNAATSIAASVQVSDYRSLTAEPLAVTTPEALPVVLRKVAKAGILEIMRSLRIIALMPTRIIRTGL